MEPQTLPCQDFTHNGVRNISKKVMFLPGDWTLLCVKGHCFRWGWWCRTLAHVCSTFTQRIYLIWCDSSVNAPVRKCHLRTTSEFWGSGGLTIHLKSTNSRCKMFPNCCKLCYTDKNKKFKSTFCFDCQEFKGHDRKCKLLNYLIND